MANVALHFDAEPGMDAAAVAQQLQDRCAQLAEVEAARSEVLRNRAVGVDDILLVLSTSTSLLAAGTLTLEALRQFIVAIKKLAEELGLKKVEVEGDGGVIPLEELTEADAQFIARSG